MTHYGTLVIPLAAADYEALDFFVPRPECAEPVQECLDRSESALHPKSGHLDASQYRSLLTDVVEKVACSVGIVLLGGFDPAELSRLLGFVAAGLAATSTRTRLT